MKNLTEKIKTITKMRDTVSGNLCDHCRKVIPECDGSPTFGTATPSSDNVIACDAFAGNALAELMTIEDIDVSILRG